MWTQLIIESMQVSCLETCRFFSLFQIRCSQLPNFQLLLVTSQDAGFDEEVQLLSKFRCGSFSSNIRFLYFFVGSSVGKSPSQKASCRWNSGHQVVQNMREIHEKNRIFDDFSRHPHLVTLLGWGQHGLHRYLVSARPVYIGILVIHHRTWRNLWICWRWCFFPTI